MLFFDISFLSMKIISSNDIYFHFFQNKRNSSRQKKHFRKSMIIFETQNL